MKDLEKEIGLDIVASRLNEIRGHSLVACFPMIVIHCRQAELRRKDFIEWSQFEILEM